MMKLNSIMKNIRIHMIRLIIEFTIKAVDTTDGEMAAAKAKADEFWCEEL